MNYYVTDEMGLSNGNLRGVVLIAYKKESRSLAGQALN